MIVNADAVAIVNHPMNNHIRTIEYKKVVLDERTKTRVTIN